MKHLPAAGLAVLLAVSTSALAQDEPRISTLTANGEGSVAVVPDIAVVTIGVTTRAETAAEALEQNSTDLDRVIATIRGEGVSDRDIGTSGFSVNPVYDTSPYPRQRPEAPGQSGDDALPKIVGYQVSNSVRVTIRDIANSGGILDKVVTAGANQINSISFDVSDRETPSDEAIREAIADARRKADLMATAAGVRLVRILDVSASGSAPVFARAEAAAMRAVPVMPGEQDITANATVSWEIAPE